MIALDENFKSVNIDEAVTRGLEVYTTVKFIPGIYFKSNYTNLFTENRSSGSEDFGLPLLRRPEHKFAVLISIVPNQKINFGIETIFNGKRDDKSFAVFPAQRVKLSPYTLINLSANYDLFDYMRIFGRIENLFDVDYEEVLGFGTPGISAFGGVKFIIQ